MCDQCIRRNEEMTAQIHAEMDEQEVPQDSLLRELVSIRVACDNNPILLMMMRTSWPSRQTLMQ